MVRGRQRILKIAVAGHLVFDQIFFPDGAQTAAFGGIAYNIAALCAAMESGTLAVVCEIGLDRKEHFERAFGSCRPLDTSLVRTTSKPNVINRLSYEASGERREWNSRIPEPLSLEEVPDDTDGLLLNFISGDDVTIEELRRFRHRFKGIVYIDYHSLALGRLSDGARQLRENKNWKEYVRAADILQMNSAELFTIVGEQKTSADVVASCCRPIHESGPESLIITMGRKGTVVSVDSGARAWFVPPLKVEAVDSTGCGDTLAAVAFHRYLFTGNIVESVEEASGWAAAKATFSGIDGFREIADILKGLPEPPRANLLSA